MTADERTPAGAVVRAVALTGTGHSTVARKSAGSDPQHPASCVFP